MRMILGALALLLGASLALPAVADQKPGGNDESPSDDNAGTGNDPPGGAGGAPPGQTTNPNPGKLWEPPTFAPAEEHLILAQSKNVGGGPGNSGAGDKNGTDRGGGGQPPENPGSDK